MRQMRRFVYKPGWDYLYDNTHLLNMPVTQFMGKAVFNGDSLTWTPHVTLLLQNQGIVGENLMCLRSQLPLLGLIGASENIRLIISRMRKSRGESQGLVLTRQRGLNDYWEIQ